MTSSVQHYKMLLELFETGGDVLAYVHSIDPNEHLKVIEYLVNFKHARDKSVQEAEKKRRVSLGVTSSWHRVKNDPVQYQKHLANNRLYRQRKKRAAEAPIIKE